MGVRLLSPDEQQIIHLREWDKNAFSDIANQIGTTEDAARMRFNRALKRLASIVIKLQRGELDAAVSDAEGESPG